MLKRMVQKKEFTIFLLIVVLSIIITAINSTFFTLENFIDMAKSNVMLGTMALGMLPVLISGGIDLSIPANITMNSVIVGYLLKNVNLGIIPCIIVAVLCGGLLGFINGVVISKFKLPPFVATLGINGIVMGFVMYFTDGNMITGLPEWFATFGSTRLLEFGPFGLPVQVLMYIVVVVTTYFILKYTLIGRGMYAIGGSEIAANRVGYNVDMIKTFIYIYSGMLAGFAAVINTSIIQSVNPNTYFGVDMTVISIAVIGGASTLGGVGSVLGTVFGTVLMAVINNGLILVRVPTFWQRIVMGFIIILAVSIDVINARKAKSKLVRVDVEE